MAFFDKRFLGITPDGKVAKKLKVVGEALKTQADKSEVREGQKRDTINLATRLLQRLTYFTTGTTLIKRVFGGSSESSASLNLKANNRNEFHKAIAGHIRDKYETELKSIDVTIGIKSPKRLFSLSSTITLSSENNVVGLEFKGGKIKVVEGKGIFQEKNIKQLDRMRLATLLIKALANNVESINPKDA